MKHRFSFEPTEQESKSCEHDIDSTVPGPGRLKYIEVNRFAINATIISVIKNEILYSLNKTDDSALDIVTLHGDLQDSDYQVQYVRNSLRREPDFGASYVNYDFVEFLSRAEAPT